MHSYLNTAEAADVSESELKRVIDSGLLPAALMQADAERSISRLAAGLISYHCKTGNRLPLDDAARDPLLDEHINTAIAGSLEEGTTLAELKESWAFLTDRRNTRRPHLSKFALRAHVRASALIFSRNGMAC